MIGRTIAAVIALLLCAPCGVLAKYDRSFRLWLTVYGIRFPLLPRPEKAKKENSDKISKTPTTAVEQPKKSPDAKKFSLRNLDWKHHTQDYLQIALRFLGDLKHKLIVRRLILLGRFGGSNPAEKAIGYGRAWALIGVTLPPIEHAFRIRKRDVRAVQTDDRESVQLYAEVHLILFVWDILIILFAALWRYRKISRKTVVENE